MATPDVAVAAAAMEKDEVKVPHETSPDFHGPPRRSWTIMREFKTRLAEMERIQGSDAKELKQATPHVGNHDVQEYVLMLMREAVAGAAINGNEPTNDDGSPKPASIEEQRLHAWHVFDNQMMWWASRYNAPEMLRLTARALYVVLGNVRDASSSSSSSSSPPTKKTKTGHTELEYVRAANDAFQKLAVVFKNHGEIIARMDEPLKKRMIEEVGQAYTAAIVDFTMGAKNEMASVYTKKMILDAKKTLETSAKAFNECADENNVNVDDLKTTINREMEHVGVALQEFLSMAKTRVPGTQTKTVGWLGNSLGRVHAVLGDFAKTTSAWDVYEEDVLRKASNCNVFEMLSDWSVISIDGDDDDDRKDHLSWKKLRTIVTPMAFETRKAADEARTAMDTALVSMGIFKPAEA